MARIVALTLLAAARRRLTLMRSPLLGSTLLRAPLLSLTLLSCGLTMLALTGVVQAYPQLHVVALSQRANRAAVAPNEIFQVTIHVKISQHRERLDELILGTFEDCEIISNETVRAAGPDGTDFTERLTLQALAPGEATISPAYIDALDPALGRPMRFSSNAVRVHVTGGAPLSGGFHAVAATARRVLLAVAIGIGGAAAIFVLGVIFLRRPKRRPAVVVGPAPVANVAPAPAVSISPHERLLSAAAAYGRERSAESLADVRARLFDLAGVGRGATLLDALATLGERDRPLRVALLAAERAMFGPATERVSAGDEMLTAIQAYADRRPANEDAWTR